MNYLIDANLSPQVVDDEIFDWAIENNSVVVTADSDFAVLLAARQTATPSVVLLRDVADKPPAVHETLLVANLKTIEPDLASGAIASLSPSRVRIRNLPIE